MKPDYRSCTLEELHDVHSNIDKGAYPERYQELLTELSTRKKTEQKAVVEKKIKKPKRKRTNKEKVISSGFVLIAVVACIYYEKTPGKHGGLSMIEEPYFFWGTLLFCVGLALNQMLTLESKKKLRNSDT